MIEVLFLLNYHINIKYEHLLIETSYNVTIHAVYKHLSVGMYKHININITL